jgi:hypothetical protein
MGSHKARVFRHRAEEFRELAHSVAPSERQAMLMTAEDYERIAVLVETGGRQADWPSNGHGIDAGVAADQSA